MISASELMIGNWFVFTTNKIQVASIIYKENGYMIEFYNQFGRNCVPIEDLQPIPLTPDILIKCVDIDNLNRGQYLLDSAIFLIVEFTNDGYIQNADRYDGVNFKPIKYLHQLQNLYFSLTQTELNIYL